MTFEPTIHPSAVVDTSAFLGKGVVIGAQAYVGPNTILEDFVQVDVGAVIGARPFDLGKQAQYFPILIGVNAFIGSNTSIQYGIKGPTRIGKNSWVNHNCCIGHDVCIGDNVRIGLGCSISGYSMLEDNVQIGPTSTLNNRSIIEKNARVGIGSLVLHPVNKNAIVFGRPAEPESIVKEKKSRQNALLKMKQSQRSTTGGRNRFARLLPHPVIVFIRYIIDKVRR